MSEQFVAVDIVLLPSDETMEALIALIDYTPESVIRLNTHDCLPHISLAMGVLGGESVCNAGQLLNGLASKYRSLDLKMVKTNSYVTTDGKRLCEIEVEPNARLKQLHTDAMTALLPLLAQTTVQTSMFVSPPSVAEISTTWVGGYYENEKTKEFRPHITLGEGNVRQVEELIDCTEQRLALCQLGSYCTCRKILAEAEMG